jgi:SRSO17 transposase
VPAAVAFTTEPKLGAAMLERALDAGVPCSWVTGDSVYGADRALRRRIEARGGLGYVLAVTSGQRLGGRRVDAWAAGVPPEGWLRLSAGEGSKGPRLYDWAYLPYRGGAPAGWAKGLLVRRELDEPDEMAFHLTLAPEGTDLATLVRVAGTRWTIEACFEAAKGEVGLDEYEVRSWTGWHRHVTLAMLAHAYLAAVRKVAVGGRATARPGRGPAAADRAGGAPAALAPAVGAQPRSGGRARLVALATPPPAARPPLPLATSDRLP